MVSWKAVCRSVHSCVKQMSWQKFHRTSEKLDSTCEFLVASFKKRKKSSESPNPGLAVTECLDVYRGRRVGTGTACITVDHDLTDNNYYGAEVAGFYDLLIKRVASSSSWRNCGRQKHPARRFSPRGTSPFSRH